VVCLVLSFVLLSKAKSQDSKVGGADAGLIAISKLSRQRVQGMVQEMPRLDERRQEICFTTNVIPGLNALPDFLDTFRSTLAASLQGEVVTEFNSRLLQISKVQELEHTGPESDELVNYPSYLVISISIFRPGSILNVMLEMTRR